MKFFELIVKATTLDLYSILFSAISIHTLASELKTLFSQFFFLSSAGKQSRIIRLTQVATDCFQCVVHSLMPQREVLLNKDQ